MLGGYKDIQELGNQVQGPELKVKDFHKVLKPLGTLGIREEIKIYLLLLING